MGQNVADVTVGELAREAGISPQILRHYDQLGLLRPSRRTAAGYRLYSPADRARLEAIRALRDLDFDLETIGRVLRGASELRAVAELQLRALEHQARVIRRRMAVIRVSLKGNGALDVARIHRLERLARLERADKARFVREHLARRMSGRATPQLERTILGLASVELPDDATLEQLDAWLELAELVADAEFLAHHKRRATTAHTESAAARRNMKRLNHDVVAAIRRGVHPEQAAGQRFVRRWLRHMARQRGRRDVRAVARDVLRDAKRGLYAKEARFWALLAVLKPELASHPSYAIGAWLMRGVESYSQAAGPQYD
ncbi:MAG TPA: MerR family transcriptional regulator [Gemmatimonadaceae bacterium]|nr:MerR family transcriptional regulator [Gemmatimonadaceae bacterium]